MRVACVERHFLGGGKAAQGEGQRRSFHAGFRHTHTQPGTGRAPLRACGGSATRCDGTTRAHVHTHSAKAGPQRASRAARVSTRKNKVLSRVRGGGGSGGPLVCLCARTRGGEAERDGGGRRGAGRGRSCRKRGQGRHLRPGCRRRSWVRKGACVLVWQRSQSVHAPKVGWRGLLKPDVGHSIVLNLVLKLLEASPPHKKSEAGAHKPPQRRVGSAHASATGHGRAVDVSAAQSSGQGRRRPSGLIRQPSRGSRRRGAAPWVSGSLAPSSMHP